MCSLSHYYYYYYYYHFLSFYHRPGIMLSTFMYQFI